MVEPSIGAAPLSLHLRQFRYLNLPRRCGQQPLVLLFVCTQPGDFAARSLRRRLYCSVAEYRGFQLRCVFALGARANATEQRLVDAEAAATGDILQLSFADAYRNLTYKSLAILDWTVAGCRSARLLLKTDLDTVVNPRKLIDLVVLRQPAERRLFGGYRISGGVPFRDWGPQKWRVTRDEFPGDRYPPFVSGMGIVLSVRAAADLLLAGNSLRLHPLEDVFLGLCAAQVGIRVSDFSQRFLRRPAGSAAAWCWYADAVAVHRVTDAMLVKMWNTATAPAANRPSC